MNDLQRRWSQIETSLQSWANAILPLAQWFRAEGHGDIVLIQDESLIPLGDDRYEFNMTFLVRRAEREEASDE